MGKTIFVVTQWRKQQFILPASFTILSRTQSSIVPLDITGFISLSRARKLNIYSLKLKIQCHLQIAQGRNITYLLSQNIFLTKQMPLLWQACENMYKTNECKTSNLISWSFKMLFLVVFYSHLVLLPLLLLCEYMHYPSNTHLNTHGSFYWNVCMCIMYVNTHAHVGILAQVCHGVWRPARDQVCPCPFPTLSFETGSPTGPGNHHLSGLAGQQPLETCLPSISSTRVPDMPNRVTCTYSLSRLTRLAHYIVLRQALCLLLCKSDISEYSK